MALVVLNMRYKKEDIIAIMKWKKVKWARKLRILALMVMSFERNERFKRKVKNRRRPRGYAVEEMNHLREAEFRKMFRLSRQSFNTMLMKVSRRLRVRDEKQAKCSSGSSIQLVRCNVLVMNSGGIVTEPCRMPLGRLMA